MTAAFATGVTQVIRLRNTTGRDQDLWIEPLGDRVVLLPGVLYEVTATDALDEIDLSAEGFVVHGWVIRVAAIADEAKQPQAKHTVWELPQ